MYITGPTRCPGSLAKTSKQESKAQQQPATSNIRLFLRNTTAVGFYLARNSHHACTPSARFAHSWPQSPAPPSQTTQSTTYTPTKLPQSQDVNMQDPLGYL